ncbi:MAG: hypothetical protein WC794_03710 [Candidatus Doudnabacteria bacterium]|jgi:hypothetical protein
MANVVPIDKKKKKEAKPTKRATLGSNILPFESPEKRNQSIGYDPELDKAVTEAELEILINNLDVSEINQQGTNDQRQVLEKIKTEFKTGNYFSALARIVREDIQLTNRTLWMFLRLNRVYQGQRTGTTDMMEMADVRNVLHDQNISMELMEGYSGPTEQKPAVEMALKTVANGETGTTEVGLDDLELAHQMVRSALKAELKNKYEDVVSLDGAQHGLSGMEMPGVKDQNPIQGSYNNNEKVNRYLRLYEALTVELFNKQQQVVEKETSLKFKKAEVKESLDRLQKIPEMAIGDSVYNQLVEKMTKMDMGQLKYLDFKILELFNQVNNQVKTFDEANQEVAGWVSENKKFSKTELHEELEKRKAENKSNDDKELSALRNNSPVKKPIVMPIRNPIYPEDLKEVA